MEDAIKADYEAMADAPWISEVPADELDRLFIRVTGNESMIPPMSKKRYPSRLMLEGRITDFTDDELRVAARLARHLTAAGDLTYSRNSGPFAHLRKEDGALYAMRMTWHRGRRCESMEEAAGVLMGSVYADLSELQPALDRFDEEHGPPPAPAPAPAP